MKTRVFLIDNHPVLRSGLAALINHELDLETCGEAGSAVAALKAISQQRPDVVVVDVNLRDGSGMDLIRKIRAQNPRTGIVVFSAFAEKEFGIRALKAGALAYVSKLDPGAHILDAIRKTSLGHLYVSSDTSRCLIEASLKQRRRATGHQVHEDETLTDREIEVMNLIGKGISTADIAASLNLSVKTIGTHRSRVKQKLQLTTAAQLVRACVLKAAETKALMDHSGAAELHPEVASRRPTRRDTALAEDEPPRSSASATRELGAREWVVRRLQVRRENRVQTSRRGRA